MWRLTILATITICQSSAREYKCGVGCSLDATMGPMVLGDDGNTYFNECLAVCQGIGIAQEVDFLDDGELNSIFDTQSFVTLEEMNRYRDEGFYLIDKRRPETFVDGSNIENFDGTNNSLEWPQPEQVPELVRARRISYEDGLEYSATYNNPSEDTIGNIFGEAPTAEEDTASVVYFPDTRSEVQDTSVFPNNVVGHLIVGGGQCSGSIISRTSVLTAGHCIYDTIRNQYRFLVGFSPGRYRESNVIVNPFGQWDIEAATTYTQYTDSSNPGYDIAVLRMKPRPADGVCIGDLHGYLELRMSQLGNPQLNDATIIGYPADKAPGSQWTSGDCDGDKYSCVYPSFACYLCDTTGGMSGSPIIHSDSSVHGVHAYGNVLSVSQNGGPIFDTQERLDNLFVWAQLSSTLQLSCANATALTPGPSSAPTTSTTNPPRPAPPTPAPLSPSTFSDLELFCFSNKNYVEIKGKGSVMISDVEVGDFVRVSGKDRFARVYSMAHRNTVVETWFRRIVTEGCFRPLEVTPHHHLFVMREGRVVSLPAGNVAEGDYLIIEDGTPARVVQIESTRSHGAIAPFTTSGDILVNGILASSYAETPLSRSRGSAFDFHWWAHLYLGPHRSICWVCFNWCKDETHSEEGISSWFTFYYWLMQAPSALQISVLLGLLPVMLAVRLMENMSTVFPLACFLTLLGWSISAGRRRTPGETFH